MVQENGFAGKLFMTTLQFDAVSPHTFIGKASSEICLLHQNDGGHQSISIPILLWISNSLFR